MLVVSQWWAYIAHQFNKPGRSLRLATANAAAWVAVRQEVSESGSDLTVESIKRLMEGTKQYMEHRKNHSTTGKGPTDVEFNRDDLDANQAKVWRISEEGMVELVKIAKKVMQYVGGTKKARPVTVGSVRQPEGGSPCSTGRRGRGAASASGRAGTCSQSQSNSSGGAPRGTRSDGDLSLSDSFDSDAAGQLPPAVIPRLAVALTPPRAAETTAAPPTDGAHLASVSFARPFSSSTRRRSAQGDSAASAAVSSPALNAVRGSAAAGDVTAR